MRPLSIAALVVGVITFLAGLGALGIAAWMWHGADARAEEALRRREQELVDKHRPPISTICDHLGVNRPPKDARTVDELLAPFHGIAAGFRK